MALLGSLAMSASAPLFGDTADIKYAVICVQKFTSTRTRGQVGSECQIRSTRGSTVHRPSPIFPLRVGRGMLQVSRNKNWPGHVAALHVQREAFMTRKSLYSGVAAIAIAAFLAAAPVPTGAQQAVQIGATDIGGVVTSTSGPEAGVWV